MSAVAKEIELLPARPPRRRLAVVDSKLEPRDPKQEALARFNEAFHRLVLRERSQVDPFWGFR